MGVSNTFAPELTLGCVTVVVVALSQVKLPSIAADLLLVIFENKGPAKSEEKSVLLFPEIFLNTLSAVAAAPANWNMYRLAEV